jgi:3'-phosphoadenosine 5'-phosphosulfate (PAPS) 3'-phosphatase
MAASAAKIFGIGLSKTGTTSLANALQILGYGTRDNMGIVKYTAGELSSVDLNAVEAFDALTDTPIPSFYRELDARYPGSKFILTVRDADGWLASCKKQFTQRFAQLQTDAHRRLFLDLYGTDVFDQERFASGYDRFVHGVGEYFRHRPGDLLMINITAGEGWEKLCPFLGRPVPDIAFPKANVTRITWMNIDDLVAVARQGGLELMRRFEGASGGPLGASIGQDGRVRGRRRLLARMLRRLLDHDALEAGVEACHRAVLKGLGNLNAQIPALSRAGASVPYSERRQWNHLWLIDPLDGEGAFVSGKDDFTVNIALIEDGRPIYGVVYAPARDTTYYGRAGERSYRRVGDSPAVKLVARSPQAQDVGLGVLPVAHPPSDWPGGPASLALSMCTAIDGNAGRDRIFRGSMEWHTGAADAVVRSAGMHVCECDSGTELMYNKPDFSNHSFTIE